MPTTTASSRLTATPTGANLYAVVTPDALRGSFDAEVLDTDGNCYLRLNGYQTVALPNAIDAERLKPLRESMAEDALLVA